MRVFGGLILMTSIYAFLNVAGATIIKRNIQGVQMNSIGQVFKLLMDPRIIGAFILVFGSALVLMKALSLHRLSLVIPLATGINFVLTMIVGVLYFNDQLTTYQYLGILSILLGIVLLSFFK